MRHKITFFTTGLARAGAELQLLLLCQNLVKAGWEVSIISLLPPVALVPELDQLGIPLFCLGMGRRFPDPRVFVRLIRVLRAWNPVVLHCHQVHANLIGRVARVFANIPVVICTAHSLNEGPRWREWAYRITDVLCDMTTQVCRAGVERYISVGASPAHKICYVPNGVDLNRFVPTNKRRVSTRACLGVDNEFVWLAVGNLREPKDYPTMLDAFRLVCLSRPHARLVIVGDGPLHKQLTSRVRENDIQGVSFLGQRDDVADLMNAADAFVMSSSFEGTPLVLLEAHAMNLPVVATRVGGISEVVIDGQSGVLVQSGDVQALARACLQIMDLSPEDRSELAAIGRAHISTVFDIDVVINEWQHLYAELWEKAQSCVQARIPA